ncbi:MAG: caspase family protein, partial [Chitinophagaceae bacterium]|nr:caspase family protein [Chitinophagaceae bacterium]
MRKALIVGINNYSKSPLQGSINDATELARILKTHGNGSPNFEVLLKTDVPTRGQLKSLVTQLFQDDCETALFYFSGHGFLDATSGFLVTPDFSRYDEGVSMDEIIVLANNSKIRNRVIILDCCHAGAFGSPSITGQALSMINEGVTVLTASRKDEPSIERNGHGVFTTLLLDALSGGAADLKGDITPGSVYAHIDLAMGLWGGQRPVFKTNVSSFVSLRNIGPSVPMETLRQLIKFFPSAQEELALDPSYEESNIADMAPQVKAPFANAVNVVIFKQLQQLHRVGLVVPHNAPYM